MIARAAPILLLLLFAPPNAVADTRAVAPAGGGFGALEVRLDLSSKALIANGRTIPIDPRAIGEGVDATAEVVAIGQDRTVVHATVRPKDAGASADGASLRLITPPSADVLSAPPERGRNDIAWEAIVSAGKAEPIFAGMTGFLAGDVGERTGTAVQIVPNGATSFVLVGAIREDRTICGQEQTLIDPQALYPASLDLRPATVQRLSPAERLGAQQILATDAPKSDPPLARLLLARGSSVGQTRGEALTDGKVETVWSERRTGAGMGEFVVMAAPKEVPIARMQIVVAPPKPDKNGAAPKTFFLVTDRNVFEVALPQDAWGKPAEAYEIAFPHPIEASCIALVLSDAYARGLAHPDVSIAELSAYSEFDARGASLDDVAKRLSGERGLAAKNVLERAGPSALAAIERHYGELDARGRSLAIDVAASQEPCEVAAPLLALGLCDEGGEAQRRAREKLERCPAAAPTLAAKIRDDPTERACLASGLASIAPLLALEPIAGALAASSVADQRGRAALRAAFAEAFEGAERRQKGDFARARLAAVLLDSALDPAGRLEVLRAAEGHVAQVAAESAATVAELLRRHVSTSELGGAPPMRSRYLALGVLAELARAGDRSAAARIADAMRADDDWPVRAHAARLGAALPGAQEALVVAARDPQPRVREAALQSLAAMASPGAVHAAITALGKDDWAFVRAQAVAVLARAPPAGDVPSADDALGGALRDPSVRVRAGAVLALARRHAASWRAAIRDRLDDKYEDVDVRSAAAQALGALCDNDSRDRLTEWALVLAMPDASEDWQQIAGNALAALATINPPDLRARLGSLRLPTVPPAVRAAAEQALAARGKCGEGPSGTQTIVR